MPDTRAAAVTRVRAPRLPADAHAWYNFGANPLPLPLPRPGTVRLLEFWTFGCINCLHAAADVAFLEERWGSVLEVIGVHSPKFDAERGDEALTQALARLQISHPVVRDDNHAIRRAFAVRAWPTFVLIDDAGYIAAQFSGEGNRDALNAAIQTLTPTPHPNGYPPLPQTTLVSQTTLVPQTTLVSQARVPTKWEEGEQAIRIPEPFSRTRRVPGRGWLAPSGYPPGGKGAGGGLHFPEKVLVDASHDRFFLSDTGSHRIIEASLSSLSNSICRVYGSGISGLRDGDADEAQFDAPRGMALIESGRALLVADSGNHALRRIELATGAVTTASGTGQQQVGPVLSGCADQIALNSPWDIVLDASGDVVFIAMAGSHQIVCWNRRTHLLQISAGDGREGRWDGTGATARFAQPSGIVRHENQLYVVDAETSSVRQITLKENEAKTVTTLAGSGDLFDWGSADGPGEAARFQHPEGLAVSDGVLWIADTYNNGIRRIDLRTGYVSTVPGPPIAGPRGVAVLPDRTLMVVETDSHRLLHLDPKTGERAVVALPGFCTPTFCPIEEREEPARHEPAYERVAAAL